MVKAPNNAFAVVIFVCSLHWQRSGMPKSQHLRHFPHTRRSPSVFLLTARIPGWKRDASTKLTFLGRQIKRISYDHHK